MKNILFISVAVLLITACQNTKSPDAQKNQLPAALRITPAQIEAAGTKSKTLIQNMDALLKEVNAASASMKGPKKTEMEAISSQLNDVMGKTEMMMKGIDAAAHPGSTNTGTPDMETTNAVPPPGVLKDYIESVDSYEKFLEDLRTQYMALKGENAEKK